MTNLTHTICDLQHRVIQFSTRKASFKRRILHAPNAIQTIDN